MSKNRGFEIVDGAHRQHKFSTPSITADEKIEVDGKVFYVPVITLPTRADNRSAGYDLYNPVDVQILPGHKKLIFLDVKAYMQDDERLEVHMRSSLAIKQGLMLSNSEGVIDASYYGNEGNDGNIGISIINTSGTAVTLKAGERVAQGIFSKYLIADNDTPLNEERSGGIGSSGK